MSKIENKRLSAGPHQDAGLVNFYNLLLNKPKKRRKKKSYLLYKVLLISSIVFYNLSMILSLK